MIVLELQSLLRRNKVTYFIGRQIRKVQYFTYYRIIFNIRRLLRVNRIITNTPYEKLKSLKDKHNGERCFIVATGPSLNIKDLEKLENEITFSMNSICLAFEETGWRPDYYGIQDINVYRNLSNYIENLSVVGKFIGDNISKRIKQSDDHYVFPLNLLHHKVSHSNYQTKFSDDAYAVVYSGYSITYSLIQIAVYMGFKEIYLLGVDCQYSNNMKHHFQEYGYVDPHFQSLGDMQTHAYTVAKEYADNHDIKIFNATRGGMLDVFERVDLDKVLSKDKVSETIG